MRHLALLLCLHVAALSAAPRAALRLPQGLVIASIKIETNNVFDTSTPPENKLLYRMANGAHIQTREYVIQRELLFAVGDRYNPALVAETERNLRLLPFIRRAEAEATVNKNGAVDVILRTYDSWTLEVVAGFKRAGGIATVKAGLAESNVLGAGKTISGVYSRSGGDSSTAFGWKDPQFFGHKRLEYSMSADLTPDSQGYSLVLDRPFYASIARRAFGGTITHAQNKIATYSGETAIGSVDKRVVEAGASYGVAIAPSTELRRRVKFGLLAHHADFQAIAGQPTGPIPTKEQLGFIQLGGDWEVQDFMTVRRIQKFTHDEDYNMGLKISPTVAWAPAARALGTTGAQVLPGIAVRKNLTWSNQLLFLNSEYTSKYAGGGSSSRYSSLNAVYYLRALRYQTLAFHAGLDIGSSATALTLGEINGLRGYGLSEFLGNRRFLLNIEDRLYVWDELLRLVDIGMVAFYDSGYAWPASSSIKLTDLKNSVGLGLRLAPSRTSGNNPVRIDLAYTLSDNRSGSRWALSVLAGQAFGP